MHPILTRMAGATAFLLILASILPASGNIYQYDLSPLLPSSFDPRARLIELQNKLEGRSRSSGPISLKRLELIFSRRLQPFPRARISPFSKHFLSLCEHHGFDPIFILAIIDVESRFRVQARSEVGALGLMQMMPQTAQFVVDELDFHLSGFEKWTQEKIEEQLLAENESVLTDPFVNTALGIAYLAWLRDHYRGSPFKTLAAYYVGPARMDTLLARKYFKPVLTKEYYEAVEKRVPRFRTALNRAPISLECLVDLRKKGCYLEI